MNYHTKNIILPIHVAALLALGYAIHDGFTGWWMFLIGWFLIAGCGIVVGFHKHLAHNAFVTHPWISKALAYLGSLGCQGSPVWWVAFHCGYHHRYTEQEKDWSSPRHGYWQSFIGWQMGEAVTNTNLKHASRLLRDPFYHFLHKHYRYVVWGTVAAALAISPHVAAYGLILPMFVAMHQENVTDLLGHVRWAGYRNYDTNDDSINNPILGLLTWGQMLHNNHHGDPANVSFSKRWWEIDPTMPIVKLLRK